MIVCTKCGTENPNGTQFCVKCGGYLDWSGVKVALQAGSAVTATLKSPDLTVEPGGQAACEVEVHNVGRLVDEYRLRVIGPDPAWCSVEPPSLRLMPKTGATARVLFRPPRAPNPLAGTAPFVVTAASSVDQAVKSEVAGSITISPFADVVATLTPQTSESSAVAEHSVNVENRGNASCRVTLNARDPDDRLTCKIAPTDMTLAPGSTASSRLTVRPRDPKEPLAGRRFPFQVLVQPEPGAPLRLDGATVLLDKPRSWKSIWFLGLAAALALILITGVVAWAGPPYPHWPPIPQHSAPNPGAVANLNVDTHLIGFGTVPVGNRSDPKSIWVSNSGAGTTTVTVRLNDEKDYFLQLDRCNGSPLGPNQRCQIEITFTPTFDGDIPGELTFNVVNDAIAPGPVELSGHGQGHAALSCQPSPVRLNITVYPNVIIPNFTTTTTLRCANSGSADLTINSITRQDDPANKFNIEPQRGCIGTLAPGAVCNIVVHFSTTTSGQTFSAWILIDSSLGSQSVPVTGYRGPP